MVVVAALMVAVAAPTMVVIIESPSIHNFISVYGIPFHITRFRVKILPHIHHHLSTKERPKEQTNEQTNERTTERTRKKNGGGSDHFGWQVLQFVLLRVCQVL